MGGDAGHGLPKSVNPEAIFGAMINTYSHKLHSVFTLLALLLASMAFAQEGASLPNVAVLAFTGNPQSVTNDEVAAITSSFEAELMNTGKVNVMERRSMDLVMSEQGLQQNMECNSGDCVQMNRLAGVGHVITGSISKINNLYSMNLKMVNVKNGQNELSHTLDVTGGIENVIREGCFEMAQIFSGIKKTTSARSTLAEKKPLVWPWVAGGVALTAGVVTAVVILMQPNDTKKTATIAE